MSFQGESSSTPFKQASLASAIQSLMWPYQQIHKKYGGISVFIETNCGSGWNDLSNIEGSPILISRAAQNLGVPMIGLYCDENLASINKLQTLMGDGDYHYYPMKNEAFVRDLPETLRKKLNLSDLKFVRGAIYVDPNGITNGFPLKELEDFSKKVPGIDIIINYPATASKRAIGSFGDNEKYAKVSDIIRRIGKRVAIVRDPEGRQQWTLMLLTNYVDVKISKEMKGYRFRDAASPAGKAIVAACDFNKSQLAEHNNRVGLLNFS